MPFHAYGRWRTRVEGKKGGAAMSDLDVFGKLLMEHLRDAVVQEMIGDVFG